MSTEKIFKRVRLGDDVSTYCGKCKEERTHQVVALNGAGGVERVVCRTCQSNHLYREKKSGVARRLRNPAEEATPGVRQVRPYSTGEVYQTDEWISHPKFGQGRIVEARSGKITVRFGQDTRTLLQAG